MTIPLFFHLYDLTEEMDYRIPLNCSVREWDKWAEWDCSNEGFVPDLEDEFGVHDVMFAKNDKCVLTGYCSYEVKKEKMEELLKKWKQKLVELNFIDPKQDFVKINITQEELYK